MRSPKSERSVRRGLPPRAVPTAAVVGAGISGCACAAVLACEGVRVLVLNSALDAVGVPGYGPDLLAGEGGWEEIKQTLAALPPVLRAVWLGAASVPADGAAVLNVDRRTVGIETKRALERLDGLEFRQGLVTGINATPGEEGGSGDANHGRLVLETAFGESIEADAVVLAIGLGLGGRVTVGSDELPGGRYGEIPANGLREALERMGATFRDVDTEVGPRFLHGAGRGLVQLTDVPGSRAAQKIVAAPAFWESLGEVQNGNESNGNVGNRPGRGNGRGTRDGRAGAWPEAYPPAAHWTETLRGDEIVLAETEEGVAVPLLSPDGLATAEVYLSPRGAGLAGLEDQEPISPGAPTQMTASRPGQTIRGLAVASLDARGRLALQLCWKPRIWVAGRAAGAAGYLDSLRSGVCVGREVARILRGACPAAPEEDAGAKNGHAGGAAKPGAGWSGMSRRSSTGGPASPGASG